MTERKFIERLAKELAEKRSDISDLCKNFLETGKWRGKIEKRFIRALIPKDNDRFKTVEYDTLTTELYCFDSHTGNRLPCKNHFYYDN